MRTLFFSGVLVLVLTLCSSNVGPARGDEIEDVLDCAPMVVLKAGSLENDYLALEAALQSKVNASECASHFEGLMGAAKELASRTDPLVADDKRLARGLKRAASKFAKLEEHLHKCDFGGYYALASNYKASLNCPLLESAVREAIRRHSDRCRSMYLGRFRAKARSVNKHVVAKVTKVIDQQLLERVFKVDNRSEPVDIRSMDNVLMNNLWAPIRKVDDLLLANIVESVKLSKYGKYFEKSTAQDELRSEVTAAGAIFRTRVYQRQLIKPCKRFVKEFADVFYAARLDLAATGSADKRKLLIEMNPEQDQEFTDTWIRFRVCQAIKEDVKGVLKRVSATAAEKLK